MPIIMTYKETDPKQVLKFVKEYFTYSSVHGGLIYKKPTARRNVNKIGQRAGNFHPFGYVGIKVNGRLYREHALVFLLFKMCKNVR